MSHPITDILAYTKKLKAAGENDAVAETHAEMLGKLLESTLATKEDLKGLATKEDLIELKVATKADLMELKVATTANIVELEKKIDLLIEKFSGKFTRIYWLGSVLLVAAGIILAKLFHMS